MPSRQQLSQREIDHVLGHYNLGPIHSINELAAGSVYSPKVVVGSDRGKLLLKRRARGLDLPPVVAFSHEVILGCIERGVCVPPMLGTKADNNSMVQFEDHVYELFVFIDGIGFDRSAAMINDHARESGSLLGELHRVLDQITTSFEGPVEPTAIDTTRLNTLGQSLGISEQTHEHFERMLGYGDELAKANATGNAIVHGDWHPGNMIYRGNKIVAVCDFDNTRIGSRVREVAQAMVHFSLKAPAQGQRAQDCDPAPELGALKHFWGGYCSAYADESLAPMNPSACSLRACAGLMGPAMIDEALAAVPAQSSNGPSEQTRSMLVAVARKALWLDEHQSELITKLHKS
ncbi:MAG: phosphotransferase [Phycisphaerales bacterium]|nr:phosphotransferase [Phycisphaerales bacterium]